MLTRSVTRLGSSLRRGLHLLCALAIAVVAGLFASAADVVAAKSAPLATAPLDAEALIEPAHDAVPAAEIPQGTEVELTGEAASGFLDVYYDGEVVWVPAKHLSLGNRSGTDITLTTTDTPLLDAPLAEASIQEIILAGGAVILTGAKVDGIDAVAHDGTGGIDERDLSR